MKKQVTLKLIQVSKKHVGFGFVGGPVLIEWLKTEWIRADSPTEQSFNIEIS